MAPLSSTLAWKIPGTGKPGGLPSMGLYRVGHDWSDLAAGFKYILRCMPRAESSTFWIFPMFSSVQFSHSDVSDSLQPHGLQHSRPPCPSPTPRVCLNSCPLSQWCHPTISSSVIPFSFRLQSSPASGSLPMSQFFASGGQSIGVSDSASVLPMKIRTDFL